jgi:hypothetical protein
MKDNKTCSNKLVLSRLDLLCYRGHILNTALQPDALHLTIQVEQK